MAAVLSLEFDQALAVHYDTMLGVREATLYQSGKPIRSFGEEDELWAPTDCNGAALPDAPRCPSSEIPKDADYDFVWDGIDAGIEVAGFGGWLTAYDLTAGFHGDDLLWQRNGSIP